MDAKLNHSDLSALLAKEANISGAKAEQFTKAMFDLIIEGLEKDGIVKINGLGTFKVTEVASRSSVNVNTGEKFEIKGHRKLTFTPADALRENVNQPFAMFEPVEVDDSYTDNDEDVESIDEETAAESVAETVVEEEATEEVREESIAVEETAQERFIPTEEEMPAEEETPAESTVAEFEEEQPIEDVPRQETVHVIEEPAAQKTEEVVEESLPEEAAPDVEEPETETVAVAEPEKETKAEAAPVKEKTADVANDKKPTPVPEKEKKSAGISSAPKKNGGGRGWIFITILLLLVAGGAYFMLNGNGKKEQKPLVAAKVDRKTEKPSGKKDTAENTVTPVDTVAAAVPDDSVKVMPEPEEEYRFVMCDELAARSVKSITIADTLLYEPAGDLAMHTVENGDRLTRIAVKYYGDKRLWPYIVMYNRLKDPNGLCRGMELAIPKLKARK